MERPSKWGETDYAAQLARMADGNGYERKVEGVVLHPAPDAELVDADDGPALRAPRVADAHSDTTGLLEGFARLADAPDSAILDYARRFGPLQICRHHLPYEHRPRPYPRPVNTLSPSTVDTLVERGVAKASDMIRSGRVTTWCHPTELEPLAVWRRYSRQVRALLTIAAHVHRGKVGRPGDWRVVYSRTERDAPWWDQGVSIDRIKVGRVVDEWLKMTGARPVMSWSPRDERPALAISAHGLFQNLARDLALTVARLDGLAVCDGCGNPYSPKRKPRADRRNFCPSCRDAGVDARLRMREKRARERGEANG